MTTTTTTAAKDAPVYEVTELFFRIARDEEGNDLGDDIQVAEEQEWTIPGTDEAYDALMSGLNLNEVQNAQRGEDAVLAEGWYITIYRYVA